MKSACFICAAVVVILIWKTSCLFSSKQTTSEGRHSVRISGLSTIDFRAGFSRKPTLDLKKTSSRPVQGQWGQPYQIVKKKKKTPQLLSVLAFTSNVHLHLLAFVQLSTQHMLSIIPRHSHPHPSEHYRAFTSCSSWQARAPVSHRQSDQNFANPLLPWAPAIRPLEHHRVHPTQWGLLPEGDRIWPGWFPVPESFQRFLLQHYTWSVMKVVTQI